MGRPSVIIAREELHAIRSANFSVKKMSELFGCSTKTIIHRHQKEEGLGKNYSTITDDALDDHMKDLKSSFPNAGAQVYFILKGS